MYHKKKIINLLMTLILSNLFAFCINANIVVSIKPIGFIASAISDGIMPIDVMVPDGASEHNYILRLSDEKKLKKTDLLIWSGSEIEPFMAKSVLNIPAYKTLILTEIEGVKKSLIKINGDYCKSYSKNECKKNLNIHLNTKKYNMHIWTSPDIAKNIAVGIHKKLLELMPQQKEKLNKNLKEFQQLLKNVDKKIMIQLAPVKYKRYFVFHDAYLYFEKHYGLSSMGYFVINPEIQPGVKHLYKIRKQIKESNVVCVFSEPQFKPAVIDTITRGIKINKGVLDPLGSNIKLSKDSYLKFLLQLSNQYQACLTQKI
ncbi:zinc ABC transporter substrate-binding protein [Candidatus Pantoea edessiphila]|uniref:High-affinity zinc uptake system protein ZnuA n=1 Tax=Candidatus Pantoea edessiphila TaxID=2044610 RepID=A0A2P5T0S5_9GAMM|nr:zinc ABC transporter substrate-binding protein ZnuA [Candidatus Pantoea edessiphila]PPI88187.1 zinc ABC transporter substrate-binding protein [Candidatus Pantoea edessiphila]